MFKIEIQQENGLWEDVKSPGGELMLFSTRGDAQTRLEELFPVLVKMEKYGDAKRTRVIEILGQETDD